jgi:hypothetical protein
MSRRWTEKEDRFIHAYFDAVGDYIGPHDLGRPKGAVMKRAKALKDSGAWDALTREKQGYHEYLRLTGTVFADDDWADEPASGAA